MKNILFACFLLCSGFGLAQEYFPTNEGVKTIDSNYRAFTGATIQIDPNTQVTDATLLIHQGKVVAAGKGIKLPKNTIIENATLFISEGDALDMRTNQLTRAFFDGRDISLETHQTKLWKRYTEKYESQ